MIGLPGSGKTTFYKRYFAATHHHVSKDLWPNVRRRGVRQRQVMEDLLTAGRSLVVDNTNVRAEDRQQIIQAGKAYGATVIGYFFDVSPREAIQRNAQRSGHARVPNAAIFTLAKRLDEPRLAEGFDQLFRVQLTQAGQLKVQEIGP